PAVGGKGRRQRAAEPGAAAQHLVDLPGAVPAVPADPAGAPEPDLLLGGALVAVRAVQARAGCGHHRILISPAGGGNSRMARASAAGGPGSAKQARQAPPPGSPTVAPP